MKRIGISYTFCSKEVGEKYDQLASPTYTTDDWDFIDRTMITLLFQGAELHVEVNWLPECEPEYSDDVASAVATSEEN